MSLYMVRYSIQLYSFIIIFISSIDSIIYVKVDLWGRSHKMDLVRFYDFEM